MLKQRTQSTLTLQTHTKEFNKPRAITAVSQGSVGYGIGENDYESEVRSSTRSIDREGDAKAGKQFGLAGREAGVLVPLRPAKRGRLYI